MATQVRVAYKTTIVFATTAFSADITSLNWTGIQRAALPTSHMGTAVPGTNKLGNATFTPGKIIDPGSIQITGHFDPTNQPILKNVPETITITWPLPDGLTTAATWAGTGFMTDFSITNQLDSIAEFSATIKMSGEMTMVDEAA